MPTPSTMGFDAARRLADIATNLGVDANVVDEEMARDAFAALASLVDARALEAHFEDKYYAALCRVAEMKKDDNVVAIAVENLESDS